MAKITPIDVIKGISGKYGGNSNDYFATKTPFSAFIRLFCNLVEKNSLDERILLVSVVL